MIAYMGSLFVSLVVPLYLEGVQGETPFIAGCLLSIPICTYATLCIVSGKVLSKRGIWPLVSCGFGLAVLGFILVYGGVSLGNIVLVLVFTALAYGGIGLAYPSVKSVDFEAVPQTLSSHASSIHSTLVQIAGSIGTALFVGIMSGQMEHLTAAGASRATAYASGFEITLGIIIGIIAVGFVLSFWYSRIVRKKKH